MIGYISFGYRTIEVDLYSALPNCMYWENCPFFSILVFHVSGVQGLKWNTMISVSVVMSSSSFLILLICMLSLSFFYLVLKKSFVHPDDFLKEPNICCLILCLVLFDFFIDFSFEFDYFLLSIYLWWLCFCLKQSFLTCC